MCEKFYFRLEIIGKSDVLRICFFLLLLLVQFHGEREKKVFI